LLQKQKQKLQSQLTQTWQHAVVVIQQYTLKYVLGHELPSAMAKTIEFVCLQQLLRSIARIKTISKIKIK
jgi:hypothetical protein